MKRKAKVTQIERATHLWPDLKVELVAVRRGRHPAIIPLESPQSNSLGYVIHGDSIGMRYLKIDEKLKKGCSAETSVGNDDRHYIFGNYFGKSAQKLLLQSVLAFFKGMI